MAVDVVGGRGGREQEGRGWPQSTSDSADAPSLVHLLSALVLRGRDEPPGSSLLTCEGAGTVEVVGRRSRQCGSRQKGRSGQQSTSDVASALSFVPLLAASVLRGRDEPPCSSLLCSEVAGRDEVVVVAGRGSEREGEGRNGQQSTSDDADAPSLVHLLSASVHNELLSSSLFARARRDGEASEMRVAAGESE